MSNSKGKAQLILKKVEEMVSNSLS